MAASPFKRELLKKVQSLGGWSVILERVAGGEMVKSIAESLGCSRSYLCRLLTRRSHPKLHQAYLAAKKEAAQVYAEDSLEIVDGATADRDQIALAKLKADQRRWLAGVYDREQFGPPSKDVNVNITTGALHFDALRAAKPAQVTFPVSGAQRPSLPPIDAEVEVVEEPAP